MTKYSGVGDDDNKNDDFDDDDIGSTTGTKRVPIGDYSCDVDDDCDDDVCDNDNCAEGH